MTYKYLDNAVKSIEYYLNSAYSHGYSDGKEDAVVAENHLIDWIIRFVRIAED